MRHDTAIPHVLHDEAAASVKDALGAFWSSVFRDQELVDALLAARVLSAAQMHIDVMEALSLRDHSGSPVFHREHWHPIVVRLSKRNTATALTVGMPDTPVLGRQAADGAVYLPNEVFVVGGNALYSKVNTYPIEAMKGCPLVQVATALCDSVSAPRHVLSQGRDFSVERGVLVIRKEQDPFDAGGYRIVEDGDDRLAVLWACDAEFDRDNVSDFLGYPLGLHAPSTDAASRMLSALWDAVTLGLTPISLNRVLGAVFTVPMVERDTVVESVTADGADSIVVTGDEVYRIETSRLSQEARTAGTALRAGSFLTDEISVYWGLSADDVAQLLDDGRLGRVVLPPGSVAGVDEAVVIESGVRDVEDGGWFKLNDGDSADSPFWQAVFARTTEDERKALCVAMGATEEDDGTVTGSVDPFKSLVPAVLANQIRVYTSRSLPADPYAGLVLDYLQQLVPSYASLMLTQEVDASDKHDSLTLDLSSLVEPHVTANLFDLDAWMASASGSMASPSLSAISRDGNAIQVTALVDTTATHYTTYARIPFRTSGVCVMAIPLAAATLRFSGKVALTFTRTQAQAIWWFYYDAAGNYISDEQYTHSKSVTVTGETPVSWEFDAVPPAGARYVTLFFGVRIGIAGEGCRFSDIAVRGVVSDDRAAYDVVTGDTSAEGVSAATESAFFRLIPTDITEV